MGSENKRPSPMGAAVSSAIAAVIGEHVSQGTISRMVSNATRKAVTNPDFITTIGDKLVKSDSLMMPIAHFVAKTVQEEFVKVEYVKKEEGKVREVPPSPPLSDPSDWDSSPSLGRNRRIRRQKRNKKKETYTSSSNSDWDD